MGTLSEQLHRLLIRKTRKQENRKEPQSAAVIATNRSTGAAPYSLSALGANQEKLNALNSKLQELGPPQPRPGATPSLHALDWAKDLFQEIQGVDAAPTDRVKAAVNDVRAQASVLTKRWKQIVAQEVPALDRELQATGLAPLTLAK